MPLIQAALGFLAGMAVPFRPEAVADYLDSHVDPGLHWLAYGTWGVCTGAVAGHWIYAHFKSFFSDLKERRRTE